MKKTTDPYNMRYAYEWAVKNRSKVNWDLILKNIKLKRDELERKTGYRN